MVRATKKGPCRASQKVKDLICSISSATDVRHKIEGDNVETRGNVSQKSPFLFINSLKHKNSWLLE